MDTTATFQVTKIPVKNWKAFRKQCIEAEVSCNNRLLQLIEADIEAQYVKIELEAETEQTDC